MQILVAFVSLRKKRTEMWLTNLIENNLTKFVLELHLSMIFGEATWSIYLASRRKNLKPQYGSVTKFCVSALVNLAFN